VRLRAVATNLVVTAETKADGSFSAADLPIGIYEVKFAKDGFQAAVYPQIIVQGDVDFNAFCNPPAPDFSCSSIGYAFPPIGRLGVLSHTIGSPRFIQMALHLTF
jgi:hypothetical protein